MNFKLKKKIGSGVMGSVFECEFNGKPYVAKLEKYNFKTQGNGLYSTYNRQIEFNENFVKKHSDKFLTLEFAGLINNCKFKQPIPKDWNFWDKEHRASWIKSQKTDTCSLLIYKPVLKYNLRELNDKNIINPAEDHIQIFKQLLALVKLLNAAGYQHSDIHPGNIMTDRKMTQWYLIDYGSILHKKYNGYEKDEYEKYRNDTLCLIFCFAWDPIKDYLVKTVKRVPIYPPAINSMKFLKSHDIYSEIVKYLPKEIRKLGYPYKNFEDLVMMICMLLDYQVYCIAMDAVKYVNKAKCSDYQVLHAKYYLKLIKSIDIMFL
jgi:serine/threonine protein kinase